MVSALSARPLRRSRGAIALAAVLWSLIVPAPDAAGGGRPWSRHTIDASSRGADGVRLADADGDGLLDIVTPWEEGGTIRLCLNPGPRRAADPWPSVTVGEIGSPEDAVLVDLDGDGALDVVSACEGRTRTLAVHWAPRDRKRVLDPAAWKTERVPAADGAAMWMFCLPLDVDGRHGIDLVAGAKGAGAAIGWLESPAEPRDLAAWRWHPLLEAGWVMSLEAADIDGDGDLDVLATDRKGPGRGCLWLEHPGPGSSAGARWPVHRIGRGDREVMFLARADIDGDGRRDIVAAVRGRELLLHRRAAGASPAWRRTSIRFPERAGTGKAVAAGDIDLDGRTDIAVTCENAGGRTGVFWLSPPSRTPGDGGEEEWTFHDVSGTEGAKYDLVRLIDLDGDGDLDILTCEERENLGVIWYENPARAPLALPRRPRILLTNDDGVAAPGLRAILLELETFADVFVAAPDRQRSGSSQSVTIDGAITVRALPRREIAGAEKGAGTDAAAPPPTPIRSITAPPASCVHIAVTELWKEIDFDLVVSGINRGQNLGRDIDMSGTVGAARMGLDLGIPAVALSLAVGSKEYAAAARRSVELIRELLAAGRGGKPVILNVNFPFGAASSWKPPVIVEPGESYFRITYRRKAPEGGGESDKDTLVLEPKLGFRAKPFAQGTDGQAHRFRHITVTPLGGTRRHKGWAKRLRRWRFFRESLGGPQEAKSSRDRKDGKGARGGAPQRKTRSGERDR